MTNAQNQQSNQNQQTQQASMGQQSSQNQQGSSSQQGQSMLSSKNLTILEDQLGTEMLNYKKLEMYAQSTNDQKIKTVFNQAAQMHKTHFESLLNYLNTHNKPMQQ